MNPVGLGPGLRSHLAQAALHTELIPVIRICARGFNLLGVWAANVPTSHGSAPQLPPTPELCSRPRLSTCRPRQATHCRFPPSAPPGHKALHPDLLSAWGQENGHSFAASQRVLVNANGNGTARTQRAWEWASYTLSNIIEHQ